jgi:hypothetical protein
LLLNASQKYNRCKRVPAKVECAPRPTCMAGFRSCDKTAGCPWAVKKARLSGAEFPQEGISIASYLIRAGQASAGPAPSRARFPRSNFVDDALRGTE